MRYAIGYISTSTREFKHTQIENLLEFSRDRNTTLGIKGILLFSQGIYFQILEGEKQIVIDLFEKIVKDPRHHGLIQIVGRDIEESTCSGYKVDIFKENLPYNPEVPKDYFKALECIPSDTRKPMEKMLKRLIANG